MSCLEAVPDDIGSLEHPDIHHQSRPVRLATSFYFMSFPSRFPTFFSRDARRRARQHSRDSSQRPALKRKSCRSHRPEKRDLLPLTPPSPSAFVVGASAFNWKQVEMPPVLLLQCLPPQHTHTHTRVQVWNTSVCDSLALCWMFVLTCQQR